MGELGRWCVRLTNGEEHAFCLDPVGETNPLEVNDEFDRGDYWSLDAISLRGTYPRDPQDNSFVLVPKDDVDEVFFEP